MKLIELNIQNCKRFNRFKNNNITLKPNKDIQIIIGANGAGKSTLLEYIFPTTPNKKDFYDDGIRAVKYNVNDKIIQIVNTPREHSFKVDGIEHNKSGILKVQQQLIEQYFNLTKDVSNLITNKVSFSILTERERREWVQRLSKIDFSDALAIHDRFVTLRRDTRGVIKHYQLELAKIDTVTEEYYRVKEREQEILSNRIQDLYNDRNGLNKVTTTEKHLNELKEQLDNLKGLIKPLQDSAVLETLNKEQLMLEQRINKINNQGESPDIMEKELEELEREVKELSYREVEKQVVLPELDMDEDLITIEETPMDIRENIGRAVEIQQMYLDWIKAGKAVEEKIHELEHVISGDKQICPSCKTVFISNQDKTVDELTMLLNDNKLRRNDINNKIEELRSQAEATDKVVKSVDNVFRILQPYNKYLKVNKTDIILTPLAVKEDYNNLKLSALQTEQQIETNNRIKELNHQIELLKSKLESKKDYVFESLPSALSKLKEVRDRISEYHNNKELINKYTRLSELYKIEAKQLPLIEENKRIMTINKSRDIELGQIKREHSELTKELNLINNNLVIKKDIKKKLSIKLKEADDLDKLIKALNPKTGLIAQAITNTIDNVLNLINSFIQKIWCEDMFVTRGDTNPYNFKIERNGQVTEDIKLGSSGMRSVIDVAFRIVALQALDQTDMFVLDEFGGDLDVKHRAKALELIDTLPSLGFKNVYVVTHFMDSGYRLNGNTELIEL